MSYEVSHVCQHCGRVRMIDGFAGEGGAGRGYQEAGFCVTPVEKSRARIKRYPVDCVGVNAVQGDAIGYIAKWGHEFAFAHMSPTCTGYSRGTVAVPDRIAKYDRLIPAAREAALVAEIPYVIENVSGARPELRDPILLCGRMFHLSATDADGAALVLDRHRLFESSMFLFQPVHAKHDRSVQVAGSYGGARRDKAEARQVRKGGYVPSADIQRALLGTPWMSERGAMLSIPPAYTRYIGAQVLDHLAQSK